MVVAHDLTVCAICKIRCTSSKLSMRSLQIFDLNLILTLTLILFLTRTLTIILMLVKLYRAVHFTNCRFTNCVQRGYCSWLELKACYTNIVPEK